MSTLREALVSDAKVHASTTMRAGTLALRDAVPSDADAYVSYWHYQGDTIRNLLGIDQKKLGTPADSRKRFFDMIRVPESQQANVIFTITLNAKVIGYTNINRYGPDENYVHLHTYRASIRSVLEAKKPRQKENIQMGAGLAAVMIGPIIAMHLNLFPVRRLVLQTRSTNRWINRALDLYMPPAETKYVTDPPGLAAPGECHVRYVRRDDLPWILGRAELLRKVDRPLRDAGQLYELP